jgi:cation diffusion facilitator CzcD-associated flavoprotein CzcO
VVACGATETTTASRPRIRAREVQSFDVVVASGHYWDPYVPTPSGHFGGEILHARDYRTPERFANRRIVVVGGGQSFVGRSAEKP